MSTSTEPRPTRRWLGVWISKRSQRSLLLGTGALFGAVWFLIRFGFSVLSPRRIDWVMSGDWYQHALGFLHYRNSPWGFPLGAITTLAAPVGTSTALTDSNPWLCIMLKPLQRILPIDFQFIGPWLLICFVLQGMAGALLGKRITRHWLGALLVAAFFVLSPVLDSRTLHPTLCAHFLLLLTLLLHFYAPAGVQSARRGLRAAVGLVVLSAGIHPTLCVEVLAVALALLLRRVIEHRVSLRLAPLWCLVLIGAPFLAWRVLGALGGGVVPETFGLGHYNADLATLIHPMDGSHLIPRLPSDSGAYEGLGFLGLGMLGLALTVPGLVVRESKEGWRLVRRHWPLIAVSLLLTLLAFSTQWRVFGKELLNLESLARPLRRLLEPFRSSGRFIWPLHYLLLATVLAVTWHFSRVRRGYVLLAWTLCLALQVADAKRGAVTTDQKRGDWYHLKDDLLVPFAEGKTEMVLVPALLRSNGPTCDGNGWPPDFMQQVLYFAYRRHLSINSGYLARSSPRHAQACEAQQKAVANGRFSKRALYLVTEAEVPAFTRVPEMQCRNAGPGYHACILR
jgi:hypothetical protein